MGFTRPRTAVLAGTLRNAGTAAKLDGADAFILFAATHETFAIQTPAAKRLIPTRVRYRINCKTGDRWFKVLFLLNAAKKEL
jgi:hypothetical protein